MTLGLPSRIALFGLSETWPAGKAGRVYDIVKRLGEPSVVSLAPGTDGNLTLNGIVISASTPIGAGVSQTAIVRESVGSFAIEYPVVIREIRADPAPVSPRWDILVGELSDTRAAGFVGTAFSVFRRLGGLATILAGSDGSLSLANGQVTTALPLVAATSRTAIVREVSGQFALEYAVTVKGVVPPGATPTPSPTPTPTPTTLRMAAVQNRVPSARTQVAGADMHAFRWPLVISADCSEIVLDFAATFIGDSGGEIGPYTVVAVSIEDPATQTVAPVRFGGSRSVVVSSGTERLPCDGVPAAAFNLAKAATGQMFWAKGILQLSGVSGSVPISQRNTNDVAGSSSLWYASADTQLAGVDSPGGFTRTGVASSVLSNGFCPMMRGRQITYKTTVGGIGDSIFEIVKDGGANTNNDYGKACFQRGMHDAGTARTGLRGSFLAAKVGINSAGLAAAPIWKLYLDAVDVVVFEPITNDLGTSSSPPDLATLQARLLALWKPALDLGKKVYQTNFTPRTSTTDAYATIEGQTPRSAAWATGGLRDQLTAWLQTKVADGTLVGVIDTLSTVQAGSDNSRWALGMNDDDVHPTSLGHEAMAGAIRTSLAVYPSSNPAATPAPAPTIAFANPTVSITEGNSGTQTVTNVLNVTRNGVTGPLAVNVTYGGSASGGTDYVVAQTSGTIADGQTSFAFDIVINGDTIAELDENIVINAALAAYPTSTASKTITILNDDAGNAPTPTPGAVLYNNTFTQANDGTSDPSIVATVSESGHSHVRNEAIGQAGAIMRVSRVEGRTFASTVPVEIEVAGLNLASADYDVIAEFDRRTSLNTMCWVTFRHLPGQDVGYSLAYANSASEWRLYRHTGTTTDIVATYAAAIGVAIAAAEIRLRGANIKVLIGGVQRIDYTDAAPYTAPGTVGHRLSSSGPTATTGVSLTSLKVLSA